MQKIYLDANFLMKVAGGVSSCGKMPLIFFTDENPDKFLAEVRIRLMSV